MEVCDPPKFVRITPIENFIKEFEMKIPYQKILLSLDVALNAIVGFAQRWHK
jgi:hypothetical protein